MDSSFSPEVVRSAVVALLDGDPDRLLTQPNGVQVLASDVLAALAIAWGAGTLS